MSIYYFENENGTFFSEDGKRRFIRLSGKDAYDYMRENKTGDSYFVQTVTDDTEDGEKVFVEVPKSSVSVYRGGTYHAQYLSKMRKKKALSSGLPVSPDGGRRRYGGSGQVQ